MIVVVLGGGSVAEVLKEEDEDGVGLTEEEMKLEQQLLEVSIDDVILT